MQRHGINEVVMTLAFLPRLIRNYFGDGSSLGMHIDYTVEETPAGTAGSIRLAKDLLDETFLVISGDALTDFDLTKVIDFHKEREAMVTIALKSVENPLEFGVVIVDEEGRIQRFLEKPGWGQVFSDTVNTGIYVLEPEVFDHIPEGQPYDFSHDLFPKLFEMHKPLYGMVCEGYWQDIGSLEQYLQANRDALDGKVRLTPPGRAPARQHLGGPGRRRSRASTTWRARPSSGRTCAWIPGPASCRTRSWATTRWCGRAPRSAAPSWARTSTWPPGPWSTEPCSWATPWRSTRTRTSPRAPSSATAPSSGATPSWPTTSRSIRSRTSSRARPSAPRSSGRPRGPSTLFGRNGVRGLANVDVTPEMAMRLAMSYGTLIAKGSYVTTSRDTHHACRVFKRAIISGLNSTGVNVRDLTTAPLAVNRFDIKSGNAIGGIHVQMSLDNPEQIEILFSEPPGVPLDGKRERAIENHYFREDFRRAAFEEMGQVVYPPRVIETYTNSLLENWNTVAIRGRQPRLVLDYSLSAPAFFFSDDARQARRGDHRPQHLLAQPLAVHARGEPAARPRHEWGRWCGPWRPTWAPSSTREPSTSTSSTRRAG